MLRRTIIRLMLFGIPCCLSYLAMRPTPAPTQRQFVICAYQGDQLVVAANAADCTAVLQQRELGGPARNPSRRLVVNTSLDREFQFLQGKQALAVR